MVRAPFPARIAAGLIVTAIEETRKLPTLIVTFPMTAVSQTLQMGMRAQQNIAELAIKGDAVLESLFDKPAEQPEWARFDDDPVLESGEPEVTRGKSSSADAVVTTLPVKDAPEPLTPATKAAATKAPDKEAAPKKSAAKKAPARKPPAKKTPAARTETQDTLAAESSDTSQSPSSDAGRFALYSSTPDDLLGASAAKRAPASQEKKPASNVKAPEVAVYIEYDALTLAQLRAKLRSVNIDELTELIDYEKAARNRVHFISMLENRIVAQQKRQSST